MKRRRRCSTSSRQGHSHLVGMTLLEVMLAAALMALLMVGVLAVVTRVVTPAPVPSDPRAAAENTSPISVAASPIIAGGGDRGEAKTVKLLERDLHQAAVVRETSRNRLVLEGHGGLDTATGDATHRRVQVRYVFREIAGQRWLIREEADLTADGPVQASRWGLVGQTLQGFEVVPPTSALPAEVSLTAPPEVSSEALTDVISDKLSEQGQPPLSEISIAPQAQPEPAVQAWRLRTWTTDADEPAQHILVVKGVHVDETQDHEPRR